MLDKAIAITEEIAKRTDEVILFHSASGKDSIALLDICAPRFKRVVCVFMYVVKNMEHINRYISYAKKKYPTCEFVQIPHFAVFSYIKYGYMGHWKDPKTKLQSMASLTDMVREKTGIQWALYGFKQSDSLNRLCMLREVQESLPPLPLQEQGHSGIHRQDGADTAREVRREGSVKRSEHLRPRLPALYPREVPE